MNIPYVFKKCTKCGEWKIANNLYFSKHKKYKFGLSSTCKLCDKKYRSEHKESLSKNSKIYREKHKKEIAEHSKEYRKNNKEKIKKYRKKYREKHKEELREYSKEYRKSEHGKSIRKTYLESERGQLSMFNYNNKRRLSLENQGSGANVDQWLEMMNFFEWKCAYSGEVIDKNTRSVDHIVPLSYEGHHEIWNLVPMLFDYNRSKNARPNVMSWYKEQEYFSEERLAKIVEWQQYAYDKWATEEDDELILITDLK